MDKFVKQAGAHLQYSRNCTSGPTVDGMWKGLASAWGMPAYDYEGSAMVSKALELEYLQIRNPFPAAFLQHGSSWIQNEILKDAY